MTFIFFRLRFSDFCSGCRLTTSGKCSESRFSPSLAKFWQKRQIYRNDSTIKTHRQMMSFNHKSWFNLKEFFSGRYSVPIRMQKNFSCWYQLLKFARYPVPRGNKDSEILMGTVHVYSWLGAMEPTSREKFFHKQSHIRNHIINCWKTLAKIWRFFKQQNNMISGYRFIVRLPNCTKWRKFVLQWRRAWNRFGSWCRGLNKFIN